uniref:Uncharacterized protein n=1 Tax=Zea mays TaxID=4577 RepID=B6TGI6_MAIZE|nr:hypothetical protein [Zea mays]|eukprot:NP_001143887.1 uncharacterized protein LOC100276688 [Zea mays]
MEVVVLVVPSPSAAASPSDDDTTAAPSPSSSSSSSSSSSTSSSAKAPIELSGIFCFSLTTVLSGSSRNFWPGKSGSSGRTTAPCGLRNTSGCARQSPGGWFRMTVQASTTLGYTSTTPPRITTRTTASFLAATDDELLSSIDTPSVGGGGFFFFFFFGMPMAARSARRTDLPSGNVAQDG